MHYNYTEAFKIAHARLTCLCYSQCPCVCARIYTTRSLTSTVVASLGRKVKSTRIGTLGRLSGGFHTLIWRPGDTAKSSQRCSLVTLGLWLTCLSSASRDNLLLVMFAYIVYFLVYVPEFILLGD